MSCFSPQRIYRIYRSPPVTYKLHPGFWSCKNLQFHRLELKFHHVFHTFYPKNLQEIPLKDWKKGRKSGKSAKITNSWAFHHAIMISLRSLVTLLDAPYQHSEPWSVPRCPTNSCHWVPPNKKKHGSNNTMKRKTHVFHASEKSWYACFLVGEYIDVFSTEISYRIGSIMSGIFTYMNGWIFYGKLCVGIDIPAPWMLRVCFWLIFFTTHGRKKKHIWVWIQILNPSTKANPPEHLAKGKSTRYSILLQQIVLRTICHDMSWILKSPITSYKALYYCTVLLKYDKIRLGGRNPQTSTWHV